MEKSVKSSCFDYLIVGAGLSGAVCADLLGKAGKSCMVIDRRNTVGGNLRCEEIEGITVHKYGAHIFRTDNAKVWEYINEFSDFYGFVNSPIAKYKDEIYNLPFNMNTFHALWGVKTPEEAIAKIESERVHIENPQNLEEHALNLVGREIYEKLIKGYTEKQWGRPCTELPPDTMRRIPVRFTFDNNYYSSSCKQGIPVEGYNAIIDKMLAGASVSTGVDFCKNREMRKLAQKIIYTGPLDELFEYEYGELEYRGLRFEHELIDKENVQGVAVVNYTEKDIPYTRTIEHKHFLNTICPKSVVTKEYPEKWSTGKEPYYPINDERNNSLFRRYEKMAKEMGIILCGRLANYQYTDMSDTIWNSMIVVERELHGG